MVCLPLEILGCKRLKYIPYVYLVDDYAKWGLIYRRLTVNQNSFLRLYTSPTSRFPFSEYIKACENFFFSRTLTQGDLSFVSVQREKKISSLKKQWLGKKTSIFGGWEGGSVVLSDLNQSLLRQFTSSKMTTKRSRLSASFILLCFGFVFSLWKKKRRKTRTTENRLYKSRRL